MPDPSPQQVTALLLAWSKGDDHALDKLTPLIYDDLRRMAFFHLQGERANHTLQPTALVNEAYIRLAPSKKIVWQNRNHFLAVASTVMRHVLVDYAREKRRKKRGAEFHHVPLDEALTFAKDIPGQVIVVHEALLRLEEIEPRKARVVELRYFGGLSVEEIADALSVSETTVTRDWKDANSWLRKEIEKSWK